MSKAIHGRLRVQPVREGKFEIRDQTDMTVAKCDDENHAIQLAESYNANMKFEEAWYKKQTP